MERYVRPVLSGLLFVIVLLLAVSILFSLLLHFTSLQESSLTWFLLPVTLLAIFIGGSIAGFKSGSRGWYVGALTGIAFLLLSYLLSFLGFDSALTWQTMSLYVLYMFIAIMGGIIGVNMSPHRQS